MLCVPVAILVSPVAWSFYPTWLIPSMLWLVRRYEDRHAWAAFAGLVLVYPFLAVVPAHFQELSSDIYALPIKTLSVAAYAALLAMEAGRGTRHEARGKRRVAVRARRGGGRAPAGVAR